MTGDLRQHLVEDHGRWVGELVGLDDAMLEALHALDHAEAALGLLALTAAA